MVRGYPQCGFADLDCDYLDRLYVNKDYQNQLIANSMLQYIEQFAKENGVKKNHNTCIDNIATFF